MGEQEPLPSGEGTDDAVARYLRNLQDEVDSAAIYEAMAEREPTPELMELYRRLAEVETRHARFWEAKLREAGVTPPPLTPTSRARVLRFLARRLGPRFVLPTVATLEELDQHVYDDQPETAATPMRAQERSHARVLSLLAGPGGRGMAGPTIARLEGRHRTVGGNALRAAVLGANDGLTSNLSLVMGVAGAQLQNRSIVITGFAGLLAGACSMAMGEYVSVQSARELAQRQISVEADEIEEAPEEEREELALIYEAKGLSPDEARAVAERMMSDRSTALQTLSREELGLDPDVLTGSPYVAAGASFLLFATGAIIPLIAFLVTGGTLAVVISIASAALGLVAIGAAITLLTGRSALLSGTRQLILGLLAAAVTFGIGRLIGVSIS
ncbi:MAG: vacuolar iron transporter family protein [Chloroflexota bacterium]|jgi:VIT1/CCC1 family predicted Fe2+/Mn2+ transporter|nr:vacuolar iron transporter family protein [Chloroflexota bacterium]